MLTVLSGFEFSGGRRSFSAYIDTAVSKMSSLVFPIETLLTLSKIIKIKEKRGRALPGGFSYCLG